MNILVCVDDTEPSWKAIEFATKISTENGSKLQFVYFAGLNPVTKLPYLDNLEKAYNLEIHDESEAKTVLIAKKIKELCNLPHTFELVEEEGETSQLIEAFVAANAIDMCIVGSRNNGIVKRFVLGSLSDYLVHHLMIPVCVVKSE